MMSWSRCMRAGAALDRRARALLCLIEAPILGGETGVCGELLGHLEIGRLVSALLGHREERERANDTSS